MAFAITATALTQSGIDTSLAGIGTMIAAIPTVARSTAYALNVHLKPPIANGFIYRCTVAGTTDVVAPTYGIVAGATTVDGTATFLAVIAPYSQICGNKTIYRISTFQAQFSGTLTWDAKLEGLEFYNCATSPVVAFNSPAVITINSLINSKPTYEEAIVIRAATSSINTEIKLNVGATLNINGAKIVVSGIGGSNYQSIYFDKGATLNITDGWLKSSRNQTRVGELGTGNMLAFNINRLIVEKIGFTIFNVLGNLQGLSPLGSSVQIVAYGAYTTITVKDFNPLESSSSVDNWDIQNVFLDNAVSSNINILGGGQNGIARWATMRKDVIVQVLNASNVPIQNAISYIRDTNNGGRIDVLGIAGQLSDNVYLQSTAASGLTPSFKVYILHGKTVTGTSVAVSRDYRTKTTVAGADLFDVHTWAYGSVYKALTNTPLLGTGTITVQSVLLADANVTLTETNAVAKLASSFTVVGNVLTVTANSTLDDVYDALKAYKTRPVQAQVEYPTIGIQPVTAAGTQLTTAMSIVVNAGSTLTSGPKFKEIVCAGVTLLGTITAIAIVGNVTQGTPTALTGVSITGSLTYNTATTAQFTFTNSTLGTVANSGAGIVTIKRINSTLTPGTNVQAYLPTTLAFTLNGGRIRVLDHLGVEQYNQTSDGTFELPVSATGTWSYKIAKYGSKIIEGTFAINGTTIALTPAYIPDPAVVDTLANIAAYTSLGTTQRIYDYYSFHLASATGILLTKTVNLGVALLDLGAFTLANSAVGITGNVIGINTATISGVDILTSGNQNGITPTSPQRITDSVATLTWVNIALNGGRIRILNQLGVEQLNSTTDATILLPKASTGTWTYKIVKYGSQPVFGSFSVDGVFKTVSPNYIPDSFVIDTATNVAAYTTLETSQKIYDYYSLYLASAAGILVTKTILLTATKLDLANYSIANSALAVTGTVIGINSAVVSGVNIVTTATQSGVSPSYPQTITDATTSSNWLNLTLNGGRIRILNHLGAEQFNQTTGGTILLPTTSTGAWTYKVTNYGSLPIFGSFNIDGTIKIITPSYIPDSAVVASLATVSAYTLLDTAQKVYDYYSLYLTSATGILETKSVNLTPVILDLGAYNLTAGAIAASATTIATGSASISGVNVATTGSISGISPAYPQQLTSSEGSTNWLRITPTTGQVYRDSVNNSYSSTASTTLLPASFTSAITIYVTRRGYKKQVVTVPYSTALLAAQAFFLIPDSSVVDLITDLTTVDLTTAQLIYDAFSQYQASLVGITDTYTPAKSPGALDFGIKGFTLLPATDFSVSPLQIKSTGLTSDTYYSQSNFTPGIATIADEVLIRASNLDSELKFTPDTVTFYPSQAARDSGTSPGLTVSGGTYRFLYGSTVNGVVMSGTVYVRVTVGVVTFFSEILLVAGSNLLDLGVQGQLTVLSGKMNNLPDAVWSVPLDSTIPAKKLLTTTASALAGKATGGGTDTITFRNLSDTATAATMTVDANGNRSAVTIAP